MIGRRRIRNEKSFALLLTLIMMVTLTVLVSAYLFMVTMTTRNVGAQQNNVQAFYRAEAGLNKAIWYLLNTAPDGTTDGSWRTTAYPAAAGANPTDPQQETLGSGTYTIWVEGSGGNITITSRGSYNQILRTVRQTVAFSGAIAAFDYAIFAGGNLTFTNSEGTVNGNLSVGNNLINATDMTINGVTTTSSTVVFPTVDMAAYAALAANTQNTNYTFNTGTYTGIWYINGNVTINDNVTFNGTVVTTGKITLKNNGDGVSFNPTGDYPAMIAQGNISGDKQTNLDINGLVYSEGSISFDQCDNTCFFNGSIIGSGNVSMSNGSGNFILTYDAALAADPPPHFSVPGADVVTSIANSWMEI